MTDLSARTTDLGLEPSDVLHLALSGHVYEGNCPDEVAGWDSRDICCPACRALNVILAVLEGRL